MPACYWYTFSLRAANLEPAQPTFKNSIPVALCLFYSASTISIITPSNLYNTDMMIYNSTKRII